MEAIRCIVAVGDLIMAAVTTWFLLKDAKALASIIGFSMMLLIFLSSAGLIIWR